MQEETTPNAGAHVQAGGITPRHGITVGVVRLPAGNPFRASCLCGWRSDVVASRPLAVVKGEQHITVVTASTQAIFDELGRRNDQSAAPRAAADKRGRLFDLEVEALDFASSPRGERDPLMSECPDWCAGEGRTPGHPTSFHDDDRWHYGARRGVLARHLHAEPQPDGVILLGYVTLYLRQHESHRHPCVWIGRSETSDGADLELEEAEAVARGLLELVDLARRSGR